MTTSQQIPPGCGPHAFEAQEGRIYSWCQCGLSEKQPLCDGAHKGTGIKSLKFQSDSSKTLWLCGCKKTQTPPYCDGSHQHLQHPEPSPQHLEQE